MPSSARRTKVVITSSWAPGGPVRLSTDEATSKRLSRIRQHGTTAELDVRRRVHALGHRFRTKNRDLPGSPDLANRRRGWIIFVHGCFWHRHPGCRKATVPRRNRAFWLQKFDANRRRDRATLRQLRTAGYRTLVVWECQVRWRRLSVTLPRFLGPPPSNPKPPPRRG